MLRGEQVDAAAGPLRVPPLIAGVGQVEGRANPFVRVLQCRVWLAAALLISVAASVCRSEIVDVCGVLLSPAECHVFEELDGQGLWLLPDSLDLAQPGTHHVIGESHVAPWVCGAFHGSQRLHNVIVGPCPRDTLGCGVIVRSHEPWGCLVWQPFPPGTRYLIVDLDGFAAGDTVLASGVRCHGCGAIPEGCAADVEFLPDMLMSACGDTVIAVRESSWGWIKEIYRR